VISIGLKYRGAFVTALACAAFAAWGVGSAQAALPTHEFDAALSLTGSCKVDSKDTVPDPAEPPCPAVATGLPRTHPTQPFKSPRSVATDSYGNIYVGDYGTELGEVNGHPNTGGRIDIFDSEGYFITEIPDPEGVKSLAVDSEGYLYVFNFHSGNLTGDPTVKEIVRYKPTLYHPESAEIAYGEPPVHVANAGSSETALAVNPLNDHLFANSGPAIYEYSSATDGNVLLETFGEGVLFGSGLALALDVAHGRIYAGSGHVIKVLQLAPPHSLIGTIDGSNTPAGEFRGQYLSVAADEGTGHVFVYDGEGANVVYEFDLAGDYLTTIDHEFDFIRATEIAVDNGIHSPNGGENPKGRYLFVPSGTAAIGHVFAFGPITTCGPQVEAPTFSGVTEDEALLQADIRPCGLPTSYKVEYVTLASYEAEGFANPQLAGEGTLPAGSAPVAVAAAAQGLQPGTRYRFRVSAVNAKGTDKAEGEFATYPAAEPSEGCSNEGLRVGFSALLPDCRAYELVTPGDTNAKTPIGNIIVGSTFAMRLASPAGDRLSFVIEGGLIPGSNGTGSLGGDQYLSSRGGGGWETIYRGPTAAEAAATLSGSNSPDQQFTLWSTNGFGGTAELEVEDEDVNTSYVHYPDGHSALVGRGSLGTDPRAGGELISEGGGHIVFVSGYNVKESYPGVHLEPNGPPAGTSGIYDRTPDEITHVVSLLPGNVPQAAGQNAVFEGASLDGRGVAFTIGSSLYLRYENTETFKVGTNVKYAGIMAAGNRVFYLESGNLHRLDVSSGQRTAFTTSGDVTPVNISGDGAVAYFLSHSVLTSSPNPSGAQPVAGEENLYRSREGALSFVGTVTKQDAEPGVSELAGLARWVPHVVSFGEAAEEPSRTTPDGKFLLFVSRADLTGYDPKGHAEVYRYDAAGVLQCLSCNPTLAGPSGEASLDSPTGLRTTPFPFSTHTEVDNLRSDGRRAFFESTEALVPGDTDGLQDVYEWEAAGVGSCAAPAGCLYLISSGHSRRADFLYAVSDSGDDVFFRSEDLLLGADQEETPSIYDARVGGGFPEPVSGECEAEGCRPALAPTPDLDAPAAPALGAKDNVKPHCPKGKRRVRRHGRVRCVKRHQRHHHRHHRKAGSGQRGGQR
jgi:hypothetical protein